MELVLAIYKSQKEGREVTLPLGEFSSLEMKTDRLKQNVWEKKRLCY